MSDTSTEVDRPGELERTYEPARIIWQAIGAVLLTVIAIWAIFQARSLVSMLVISVFFSLALQPAVNSLVRRYGWRRGAAVGVIYLALVAFMALNGLKEYCEK